MLWSPRKSINIVQFGKYLDILNIQRWFLSISMKLDDRIFMYFLDNIIVQNYWTDLQNGPLKTHFIQLSTYFYFMIQFIFYLKSQVWLSYYEKF